MSESIAQYADVHPSRQVDSVSPLEVGWHGRSLQGLARRLVLRQLGGLDGGHLRLVEGDEELRLGADPAPGLPSAEVRVHDPEFYSKIAFGGAVGAAEAFMAGLWTTPNLTAVLQLIVRHRSVLDGMETGWARLAKPLRLLFKWLHANTVEGSRRNIYAHYDLGNEFFELFLDRRMMYSSAIFEDGMIAADGTMDLDAAAEAKLERLCQKLELTADDHLLEIGTGWGGFAIYAAQTYGCRITTTTISPSQHAYAVEAVRAAGLEDRIEILQTDYRKLTGTYDKLISIEMIEAVGHEHLEEYFECCARLLKPEGRMALQGITINDRVFDRYRKSVDFIQRYIFPGSCLVSLVSMTQALARGTDLQIVHVEDIGPHYADTLKAWRERFFERLPEVEAMGFSKTFVRMWDYYLSYCEAGFRERSIGDVQVVLSKPFDRRDIPLGDLS